MTIRKSLITLSTTMLLALSLAACSDDDGSDSMSGDGDGGDGDGDGECMTIAEIATSNDDFSILVEAATKAGLVDALGGDDITVFAPTNEAFADLLDAVGASSLDDLSAEQLVPILTYHVADSKVDAETAISVAGSDDPTFGTLGGTTDLELDGDDLMIDGATVINADIEACNGIIHAIDGVIVPSIADMVLTQANLSSLKGLVEAATSASDIVETLDTTPNVTLFAPENDAIDAISEAPDGDTLDTILTYHAFAGEAPVYAADALELEDAEIEMVSGGMVTVNGGDGVTLTDAAGNDSSVTVTDLYASNGVVHIIDGVLLPE